PQPSQPYTQMPMRPQSPQPNFQAPMWPQPSQPHTQAPMQPQPPTPQPNPTMVAPSAMLAPPLRATQPPQAVPQALQARAATTRVAQAGAAMPQVQPKPVPTHLSPVSIERGGKGLIQIHFNTPAEANRFSKLLFDQKRVTNQH